MLLPQLFSLAHAAPALRVAADVVISEGGAAAGQILLSASGEPRLALYDTNIGHTPMILVPSAEGWVERPVPRGVVAEGPEDLVLLAEPQASASGRRLLANGKWTGIPGSALPTGATGPAAVDGAGRATVFGYDGAGAALWREAADGAWSAQALPVERLWSTFAQGGELWRITGKGILGPRTLRRSLENIEGVPAGTLDSRGQPALVWTEGGRILVQHSGGLASLDLPKDISPTAERCVSAPCESVLNFATAGIAGLHGTLAVPYVRGAIVQQTQCRPYDGPYSVCTPAGPFDTCPDPPQWTCEGPETRTHELRLATVDGGKVEDRALGQELHLGNGPLELWDVAGDTKGRLHLLFRTEAAIRYALLSPEASPVEIPTLRVPAPPVVLDTLDETTLGLAGFATGLSAWAGDRAPGFAKGEAHTGGEHGPGWWTAGLSSTPGGRTVALDLQLEVEAVEPCGRPALQLVRGGQALTATLTPEGIELQAPGGATETVPLPQLPTRLRLELGPNGGAVSVDDRLLMRTGGIDAAISGGYARFGDTHRCGAGGGATTRTRWQKVKLER